MNKKRTTNDKLAVFLFMRKETLCIKNIIDVDYVVKLLK